MTVEKIAAFLRQVFSEANGNASSSRILSAILVCSVVAWNTANLVFAWRMNHLLIEHPVKGINTFPLLPDAATITAEAALASALYGFNKAFRKDSDGQ